jgi:hypothetical protein
LRAIAFNPQADGIDESRRLQEKCFAEDFVAFTATTCVRASDVPMGRSDRVGSLDHAVSRWQAQTKKRVLDQPGR